MCHACQLGRHIRLPFHALVSRASDKFDLIHCDLGTSPDVSLSSYNCAHYQWTFPLRLKSDTYSTPANFLAYASTRFGASIKAIQCDNGKDLTTPMLGLSSSLRASTCACPAPAPRLKMVKLNELFVPLIMVSRPLFAPYCFRPSCLPPTRLRLFPWRPPHLTSCPPQTRSLLYHVHFLGLLSSSQRIPLP